MEQNDVERLIFFQHACQTAENAYATNPLDADNLTRWGGALLELSQFQSVPDSKKMIEEAILKLEEVLVVNPRKHDALWLLGNANTSHAFLTSEAEEARIYFDRATEFFLQAVDEDPSNELYCKSLQVTAKAPELHAEIHRHGLGRQTMGPAAGPSSTMNLKYDIFGWIILAVGIVAWVGFAKSQMPAPPPPPR